MRTLLCGLAAAAVIGGTPSLADPIYYIGNTLLIKRATGVGKLTYKADHTFTLLTLSGETVDGAWTAADGKLCLKPQKSKMQPFCVADDPVHKVGDAWSVKSPDGVDEQLTLVAGQN